MRRLWQTLLFIAALGLLLFSIGFFPSFFELPSGIHFIRQADGLSFALNYALHNTPFFAPENFNLFAENGSAASEFPLFYKAAAVCGHDTPSIALALRLFHAFIFFGGIISSCFILLRKNHKPLAVFASISLVLLSTVVLYYSNNFLPDIVALGLTIAAFAMVFSSPFTLSNKENYIALILFVVATLVKITYAIYPISWLIIGLLQRKYHLRYFKYFMLWASPVAAWWTYVMYYNKSVANDYYSNRVAPYWSLSTDEKNATWDLIFNYWKNSYIPELTQWIFGIAFTLFLLSFLTLRNETKKMLLLVFLGIVSYVLLFFQKFHDHDYYFLVIIPFILFVLIWFFEMILRDFPNRVQKLAACTLIVATIFSAYSYVKPKLNKRYVYSNPLEKVREQITPQIHALNLKDPLRKMKVIVIGDSTINGMLHMTERKGFTLPSTPDTNDIQYWNAIRKKGDVILLLGKPDARYAIEDSLLQQDFPQLIQP